MRWLCLHLPRLPLQCLQPTPESPAAVVERQRSRRWLIACDDSCAGHGIEPGCDATSALARCPELRLLPRALRQEQASLKALAGWAGQFSSFVSFDAARLLLWMEVGSSLRYFGGIEPLLRRVHDGLGPLGYSATTGVASTPEAAALLARLGDQAPLSEDTFEAQLASLPLQALALPADTLEALQASGLRSIGEVLAIPADALARRFSPDCVTYLQRLTGRAADPRKPCQLPSAYRRRFELAGSVESSEALLFPLRRILGELEGFLRGRDAAVRQLTIRFRHEDHPDTTLVLRATRPVRSAARLHALLRERLERCTLAAATDEIHVEADRLVSLGDTQLSLLDDAAGSGEGWPELLDRLRARLGDEAVRGLGLRDDHRPEHAWCVAMAAKPDRHVEAPEAERPLWLLEPRAIGSLPPVLGDPERIETGWWDGHDIARDYYQAQTDAGSCLWLYRERDSRQWFLHGLWA